MKKHNLFVHKKLRGHCSTVRKLPKAINYQNNKLIMIAAMKTGGITSLPALFPPEYASPILRQPCTNSVGSTP